MKANLKHKKAYIGGTTGSGKTHFIERCLLKGFKKPLVLTPHREDFKKAHKGTMVYYNLKPFNFENFDKFVKDVVKPLALKGEIDSLFIDESDLLIPKNNQVLQMKYPNTNDMIQNHRHWGKSKDKGIALGMITRRPQAMNTDYLEVCHWKFTFALEGKNVNSYMESWHADYEKLMSKIDADKHNFIAKEMNKPPVLCGAVKC